MSRFVIKILISFLIFFTLSQSFYSQNIVEMDKYKMLAMLSLFSEGLNFSEVKINKENLNKFISQNEEIKIIDQDSFEDFVFLTIKADLERKDRDRELPVIWSSNECKEYILAINKSNYYIYKLKGYRINDFHSFLFFLRKYNYKNVNKRKSFTETYKVNGLDFNCLYKSLRIKKEKDIKKYPCIANTCLRIYKTHDW